MEFYIACISSYTQLVSFDLRLDWKLGPGVLWSIGQLPACPGNYLAGGMGSIPLSLPSRACKQTKNKETERNREMLLLVTRG